MKNLNFEDLVKIDADFAEEAKLAEQELCDSMMQHCRKASRKFAIEILGEVLADNLIESHKKAGSQLVFQYQDLSEIVGAVLEAIKKKHPQMIGESK